MNVKRNDKCPCGSGKKYKHCCQNGSMSGKSNKFVKLAIITSICLLAIASFYAIYESVDYPEQEYYKCENPNCNQLHKRAVSKTESDIKE
tara:strand:- start:85 stop:354 length:270 start_codon:yes stop_codon:yes gene_type:complete